MIDLMLKEVKEHGSTEFPVNAYEVTYTTGFTQILPCHWHEEYEIIYVSKGSSIFRIGDKSIEVNTGQVIFINSNELHSSYCENPSGCCYTALVFHMSLLHSNHNDLIQTQYITPFLLKQIHFPMTLPTSSPVAQLISQMVQITIQSLLDKKPGYELAVKGSIYMLLSTMVQNNFLIQNQSETTIPKGNRLYLMKNVLQYIAENYSETIYINDLASFSNMSRYHFCRFFKNYIGMTPIEYLNFIRINEAYKLLLSSNISVTEVALQTGFENLSYFTKIFKKQKGISPSHLLKANNKVKIDRSIFEHGLEN